MRVESPILCRRLLQPASCTHTLVSRRLISTTISKSPDTHMQEAAPLAKMSTGTLLRSVVLTSIMANPFLLKPCLALMGRITRSNSTILNPDKNPILAQLLRHSVYNHFCAGETSREVKQTIAAMKRFGFGGVILGYAKEFVSQSNAGSGGKSKEISQADLQIIERWKQGTLETLYCLDKGDFLAIKFTGAGPVVLEALENRQPMPAAMAEAVDEICLAVADRGCRTWVDAEQQFLQHGVDDWVIDLMRKYNKGDSALVYNTIQSYLKGSRPNIQRHINVSAKEGWTLGIKLVRGAYIEHEERSLIHDTKAETDNSYNSITRDLINQTWPSDKMPLIDLFVATHNAESVEQALGDHRRRVLASKPTIKIEFGQIQGMADELSGWLLNECKNEKDVSSTSEQDSRMNPKVYKCLCWGSVSETMGYLYRRAIENKGAVERTEHMAQALRDEFKRRIKLSLGFA